MKKKAYLIPLLLGIVLLAVGVVCFGRVCAIKDNIYSAYKMTFSDDDIENVFINDHDEATVKADFDAAMLAKARSGSANDAATDQMAEPIEGEVPAEEAASEEAPAEEASAEEAPAEAEAEQAVASVEEIGRASCRERV